MIDMYSAFVIGRDLNAARDIVHIIITSLWFLSNVLRQIATGWVFQLNGMQFSESVTMWST
jgi:hypothetical protein